jgi:hypothetical protein
MFIATTGFEFSRRPYMADITLVAALRKVTGTGTLLDPARGPWSSCVIAPGASRVSAEAMPPSGYPHAFHNLGNRTATYHPMKIP